MSLINIVIIGIFSRFCQLLPEDFSGGSFPADFADCVNFHGWSDDNSARDGPIPRAFFVSGRLRKNKSSSIPHTVYPRKSMTRDAMIEQAQSALMSGDSETATRLYRDVLDARPGDLRALDGLGVSLCHGGDFTQAITVFRDAMDRLSDPAYVAEQFLWTETEAERSPEAEAAFRTNCRATLFFHQGMALHCMGYADEALEAFRQAFDAGLRDADFLISFGQLCFERHQRPEAVEAFRCLTEVRPGDASAWLTLGYLLSQERRFDAAVTALRQAVKLDESAPDVHFYLAEALRHSERHLESLGHYQKMLPHGATRPQAVHGYGKSLLALGHFADGWDAMEFRTVCTFGTWERHWLPAWDGNGTDKTVLAYSEEGTATEIMFASCLPDLIRNVGHAVIECAESLHGLFRRSFPQATIVPLATEDIGQAERADEESKRRNPWQLSLDEQIAFGSLPRHFRRSREDFPLRKSYLVPDREKVEAWSRRLAAAGSMPRVGVLWSGSWTAESERQTRLPLPELSQLLFRHPSEALWVNLQNGSRRKEFEEYRRGVSLSLRLYPEAFRYDLDEMAGLLANLDLVITPPGYVAQLAGALGVRTWTILPARADWRWKLGASDCLWHPGMKVFRQRRGQAWEEVFRQIQRELQVFLANSRPPEEVRPELSPTVLAFPGRNAAAGRRVA